MTGAVSRETQLERYEAAMAYAGWSVRKLFQMRRYYGRKVDLIEFILAWRDEESCEAIADRFNLESPDYVSELRAKLGLPSAAAAADGFRPASAAGPSVAVIADTASAPRSMSRRPKRVAMMSPIVGLALVLRPISSSASNCAERSIRGSRVSMAVASASSGIAGVAILGSLSPPGPVRTLRAAR